MTVTEWDDGWVVPPVLLSAHAQAAEIERLTAKVEELEVALKTIRIVVGAVTAVEADR